MRKRVLPVVFQTEGDGSSISPVENAAVSAAGKAEKGQGLIPLPWASGAAPPEAGLRLVDQAAGDTKLGTLVAVSPGEPARAMYGAPRPLFLGLSPFGMPFVIWGALVLLLTSV